jgi:hypothetical protein
MNPADDAHSPAAGHVPERMGGVTTNRHIRHGAMAQSEKRVGTAYSSVREAEPGLFE